MARTPSREDDDRLLAMLNMRARGHDDRKIAAELGTTSAAVYIAMWRIREADVAESGEPKASVIAAYGAASRSTRRDA